jgi:hypothetical protein
MFIGSIHSNYSQSARINYNTFYSNYQWQHSLATQWQVLMACQHTQTLYQKDNKTRHNLYVINDHRKEINTGLEIKRGEFHF